MVEAKLIVEGGGQSKELRTRCREAFSELMRRAGFGGRMPRIIASGSRDDARDEFENYLKVGQGSFLLVDSEAPVAVGAKPWAHLKARDNWKRPVGAKDDHCHLMVQCMETWFLADVHALETFYGQGFAPNALPHTANIEVVSTKAVLDALERATRGTKTKGEYGKSAHSFKILHEIDPSKLRKASEWADRFFATLDRLL